MNNVMIVDDELYICEMIKRLIDWEGLSLHCAGEANDGMRAIDKIREFKPDIVLTDIRMPGVDGLEMIRQMREEFPDLFFVVFSGHKDFDYACSAIKYGVEDYLLKPINKEKLNNVLSRIKVKLEQKLEERDKRQKNAEQLEYTLDRLRSTFVNQIFEEKLKIHTIEDFNKESQCHYSGGQIQVLAVKLDELNWRYPQEILVSERQFILERIGNEALDFLKKREIYTEKFIYREELYLVIEIKDSAQNTEIYKDLFREIRIFMERYPTYSVTAGMGAVARVLKDYMYAFKTARATVYKRIREGTEKLLLMSENRKIENDFSGLQEKYMEELRSVAETGSELEMHTWVERITEEIIKAENSVYGLLITFETFLKEVLYYLSEKSEDGLPISEEEIKRRGRAVYEYTNEAWLVKFIKNTIMECFEKYIELKRMQAARPVREAKKYINEHYQEDITLDLLAEKIYLNSIYLSTLFKKEEGMNFSKYLLMVRMNNAKSLLANPQYTIAQVGEQVGYKDYKHFSKVFKKYVGITPNEYRKLNY